MTDQLRTEKARLRRLKRQLAGRQKQPDTAVNRDKIETLVRQIRMTEIRIANIELGYL